MCFSPKMKTPKIDTGAMKAVEPAPLTEEPKGVLFGGDEEVSTTESDGSGSSRKNARVDKAQSAGVKKSISNKAFGS